MSATEICGLHRVLNRARPASRSEQSDTFSAQSTTGGIYLAGRYGLGVLVSLGNMLVMTCWIGPHAYGLFVTGMGFVACLAAMARGGVDTYLIRNEEAPNGRMYAVAATFVLIASIGLAIAGAGAIPLLTRWYGNAEFVPAYGVLLGSIPMAGLTGVPMAKLERALNFRSVATIEGGGQLAGLVVSAFLAWAKAGVWAAVAGQITSQAFTFVSAMLASSLAFRLCLDVKQMRRMLSYGAGLTASQRVWQLRTLVSPLLVGRFAGADAVAYVALAARIAEALGTLRLAAGRIVIAALARLQEQKHQFQTALERALLLQVVTLGPLLCGVALLGPFLLSRLLGVRWTASLLVYPFIAAGVLVNSIYNLQASALFVVGKQWVVLRWYTVHLVLLSTITLVLLPRLGILGYGWAELLACVAYVGIHRSLGRVATISYRQLGICMAVFLPLLFAIPGCRFVLRIIAST